MRKAIGTENYQVVDAFIQAGVSLHDPRYLDAACRLKFPVMYQRLVAAGALPIKIKSAGAPINKAISEVFQDFPVITAIATGQKANAAKLISQGKATCERTAYGITPLMVAAALGDLATITRLLKAGCDIHEQEREGNSSLHFALMFGRESAVQHLIDQGADVTLANHQGKTPATIRLQSQLTSKADEIHNPNIV
jgi:ankyrin repeat protein